MSFGVNLWKKVSNLSFPNAVLTNSLFQILLDGDDYKEVVKHECQCSSNNAVSQICVITYFLSLHFSVFLERV